jgi:hypothetical protein
MLHWGRLKSRESQSRLENCALESMLVRCGHLTLIGGLTALRNGNTASDGVEENGEDDSEDEREDKGEDNRLTLARSFRKNGSDLGSLPKKNA